MNGNTMGTAVKNAIAALSPDMTQAQKDQLELAWKAICTAIVAHIAANATVTATVAVTSVAGVTTGGGVSGPGAGTATGTVA